MQIPVPLFICPSALLTQQSSAGDEHGSGRHNITDRSDWGKSRFHHGGWLRLLDLSRSHGSPARYRSREQLSDTDWMQNGVLYPNSATKISDITDGTSNTLLMGDSRYGLWGDGSSCCARFRNDRSTPTDFDNYWFWVQQPPVQAPTIQYFSFGSLHEDMVIFALCDGSSRPIAKTIDKGLIRKLATSRKARRSTATSDSLGFEVRRESGPVEREGNHFGKRRCADGRHQQPVEAERHARALGQARLHRVE